MKKKRIIFIIFLLMLSITKVNAADLCTSAKYSNLKKKAASIKAEWELNFDESHKAYFTIKLTNVDKDVLLKYNETTYEPVDGEIILNNMFDGGNNYQLKLYGGYETSCVEEYLYTKNLKVPSYNYYSEYEKCKENPEFMLCDMYYDGVIENDTEFYGKLNEYLKSDEYEKVVNERNNKKYITYIAIVAGIIVIAGGTYFVINKKKILGKRKKAKNEKK